MTITSISDYPSEVEPTSELRWLNGKLQQKWVRRWEIRVGDKLGYLLEEEWRDVPEENDE